MLELCELEIVLGGNMRRRPTWALLSLRMFEFADSDLFMLTIVWNFFIKKERKKKTKKKQNNSV